MSAFSMLVVAMAHLKVLWLWPLPWETQHDNAPAHWAHGNVRLLEQAIPPDLWPANSPQVDYRI